MITVKIKRSKWSRGDCGGDNKLLVEYGDSKSNSHFRKGNMCCLGFACLVLGAKKADILDRGLPSEVNKVLLGLKTEDGCDTLFSERAAEINDSESLTDRQREARLRELAKANGFKFVFVP